uniref:Uncharacterized protein n=1 Tax=Cacopsylla melanoneura TaxID=428564 RepID=A0A8D8T2Q7_9HEMI
MERFKVKSVKSETTKNTKVKGAKNAKIKTTYGSTKYEEVKTGVQADLLELRSLGVQEQANSSLTTGKVTSTILLSVIIWINTKQCYVPKYSERSIQILGK